LSWLAPIPLMNMSKHPVTGRLHCGVVDPALCCSDRCQRSRLFFCGAKIAIFSLLRWKAPGSTLRRNSWETASLFPCTTLLLILQREGVFSGVFSGPSIPLRWLLVFLWESAFARPFFALGIDHPLSSACPDTP